MKLDVLYDFTVLFQTFEFPRKRTTRTISVTNVNYVQEIVVQTYTNENTQPTGPARITVEEIKACVKRTYLQLVWKSYDKIICKSESQTLTW